MLHAGPTGRLFIMLHGQLSAHESIEEQCLIPSPSCDEIIYMSRCGYLGFRGSTIPSVFFLNV